MKGLVFAINYLFLKGIVFGLKAGENCLTPDGEDGTCIRLRNCSHYSSLLQQTRPPSAEILKTLEKAVCGMEDKPLLCCPKIKTPPKQSEETVVKKCFTPTGGNGKCVAKNECPAFSSTNTEFLEQTRCGRESSSEMYCCPSQAHSANNINHRNIGLLDFERCGPVTNINILHANGSRSEKFGFPWVALIAYSEGVGEISFQCSGSLISKRYVLTAAHCLKYLRGKLRPFSVRLGELNLETKTDCTEDECLPPPQDIAIESTIIHPGYKGWPNYEHDIALLRLASDVNLNSPYVKPVCLPIGKAHESKDLLEEELLASGWCVYEKQDNPVLLQRRLKGISHEECTLNLKKEILISADNQLCTTSEKNNNCEGYGGSPLVKYDKGSHRQVAVQYGIVSFGPKHCSQSEIPLISTRLSQYSGWILDQMTK